MKLALRDRTLDLAEPVVMGVLNVTPDSFSDGGLHESPATAIALCERLLADGAGCVILPTRQDIADITDLRFETISRIIKSFERERVLSPLRIAGVHATRAFRIGHASGC